MIYLSIVGTQALAELNPILSLLHEGYEINSIVLLATKKSKNIAEKIKKFIIEKYTPDFNDNSIIITEISDSLQADEERPSVSEEIRKYENEIKIFNIAGGMNFQTSACATILNPENTTFVYPESEKIHVINLNGGEISDKELPLPEEVDVAKLQGIEFEYIKQNDSSLLWDALEVCNIDEKSLSRILYRHIKIKNVTFDLVLNSGNTLKFLKVIHKPSNDKRKPEYYRIEARKIMAFANNRADSGELYHKEILIFTNNASIVERIEEEGRGKVKALLYYRGQKNPEACMVLKKFFGISDQKTTKANWEYVCEKVSNPRPVSSILYLMLGEDIMPTLIALKSHNPSKVCFLYTPDNENILKYKEAILLNKNNLNVKEVSFFPVSIIGYEILKAETPEDKIDINITPGTKAQGFFLSLYAKKCFDEKRIVEVYSIDNKNKCLRQIFPEDKPTKELKNPDPINFLKFKGEKVEDYGDGKGDLLGNRYLFTNLRDFINLIKNDKGMLIDFPDKEIKLKEAQYIKINRYIGQITFNNEYNNSIEWSIDLGIWFERYIGFIIVECGANDVQVRLRAAWCEQTQAFLRRKYPDESSYRSDIDIVARFNEIYYIIECKSGKIKNIKETAEEVKSNASIFGRFAVPLIAHLNHIGEPELVNNVYVFGAKTFNDITAMKLLLEKVVKEKKTTF